MLVIMLVSAIALTGALAGVAIVGALLIFSMASGAGSVAFKDVMGKTIPKGKRGQLLGLRASIGGGLTIAAGLILYGVVPGTSQVGPFLVLLGLAAVVWALAAGLFALIDEQPGATQGGRNALEEARSGLGLLWRRLRVQALHPEQTPAPLRRALGTVLCSKRPPAHRSG